MKLLCYLVAIIAGGSGSSVAANRDLATQLLKHASASAERLQTNSAQWEVRVTIAGKPVSGLIRVLKDGQRISFLGDIVLANKRSSPLFAVLSESNIWYVAEVESFVKCRPWEHFFQAAVSELMLEAAELRFATDRASLAASTAISTNTTSIAFREELDKSKREEIAAVVRELNSALPAVKNTRRAKSAEALTKYWSSATNGLRFSIHREAGFLDRWETPNYTVEVSKFRWLPATPTNRIRIPKATWQDRTDPFHGADWNRCVFVGHDPSSEPGEDPRISPRLGVLRLDTGSVTRVPLPTLGALSGCFLSDRRVGAVVYQDMSGGSGLALVNLQTSEITPVDLSLDGQLIGMPVLSPDKKKIALLYRPNGARSVVEFQMLLFDIDTQAAKPWGEPGRLGGPYSWLPDGNGIVLKRFVETPGRDVESRVLCILRLDGRLVDVRRGDMPLVLPGSKSILFEEEDQWFTCDFEGGTAKIFLRGMKGWGTPALSPDESEILWVRFSPPKLPQMHLFPFGSDDGKVVTKAPGFTGLPSW